MEHYSCIEYGEFAKRIGTDKEDLIFTTTCSELLARNRALERIRDAEGLYDPESVTVRTREKLTVYGEWSGTR